MLEPNLTRSSRARLGGREAVSYASWSWCIPNECFIIFLQNLPNQNVNFRKSNQEVHFKSTQTRLRTAKHSQMHPTIIPDRSPTPSPVEIRILKISFSRDLATVSLYPSRSHLPARSQNLIVSKKTHDGREFPIARTSELDFEPIWICRSRLTVSSYVHMYLAFIRQAIFPRPCMGYATWP